MSFYLSLPLLFLKFWYMDGPYGMFEYFASVNHAFFQLFSLPLLIKTYFKPWKNEYRKNFVPVAIGLGIVIKTFVILADLIMLVALLTVELIALVGFILLPLGTVYLLLL